MELNLCIGSIQGREGRLLELMTIFLDETDRLRLQTVGTWIRQGEPNKHAPVQIRKTQPWIGLLVRTK